MTVSASDNPVPLLTFGAITMRAQRVKKHTAVSGGWWKTPRQVRRAGCYRCRCEVWRRTCYIARKHQATKAPASQFERTCQKQSNIGWSPSAQIDQSSLVGFEG